MNLCPLGSGAVAGATLPLDRACIAANLGFDGPTLNSIDATSDRDFALEFVNALAILATHLSRWAEEMILFSSQEFGFLSSPESYSTGSSAMPQKKNPDLLELVRGKTGKILGNATSLAVTMKGLPLAYNKDLQEMQQPVFDSTETLLQMLPLVTEWMRAVEFHHDRMLQSAQSGSMNAWAAATYLVHRVVPSRLAHETIGKAVQMCLERNCELQDLPLRDLQSLSPVFSDDFYDALKLEPVLAIHDVRGGTAPTRVREAINAVRNRIGLVREEVHAPETHARETHAHA
jgi:argininosuccinate lyase